MARSKPEALVSNFVGGLNQETIAEEISPNEAASLQNFVPGWYPGKRGALVSRDGNLLLGNDKGSLKVLGLHDFVTGASTHKFLMGYGTVVAKYAGSNWDSNVVTGLTTGLELEFEEFRGKTGATHQVSSTATSATSTTLADTGASWTVDTHKNRIVHITGGTGAGQCKLILSNTATVLTIRGSWETTPDATSTYKIWTSGEVVYMSNGTDAVQLMDGSENVQTIGANAWDGMKPTTMARYGEMLLIGGDATYPSRVRVSELGLGDYTPDFYDISPDDGYKIVCIKTLRNQAVIYKEDAIYGMIGSSPSGMSVVSRTQGVVRGTVARRSVQQIGNYQYFLARDGVYRFDGFSTTPVAQEKIQTTIDGLNQQYLDKAAAGVWRNRYYLSVPNTGSAYNNLELVYDPQLDNWTINTGVSWGCYETYTDSNVPYLFAGEHQADTKVYKIDDGYYGDNGTTIAAQYDSKEFNMQRPQDDKTLRYLYVKAAASGSTTLTVTYGINGATPTTSLGTCSLTTGSSVTKIIPAERLRFNTIQFRFAHSSSTVRAYVYSFRPIFEFEEVR